jgi:hypothetical protein
MIQRFCIYFLLIFFCANDLKAQEKNTTSDKVKFAAYLVKNNLNDDFFTLLKSEVKDSSNTQTTKDSLNLLAGHAFYQTANKDTAVIFFNKVNTNSPIYGEACFNSGYILAETGSYNESRKQVEEYTPANPAEKELKQLHLAGVALLIRDTSTFSAIAKAFPLSSSTYSFEENKLKELYKDITAIPKRSGFLAGTMSAIIPGLGKIYAGEVRQGLTSFIPVTILGLQAFEAYNKAGFNSVRFYASAALFSVFYIGNIWGSVLSVSVKRNEINNEINDQILFDLRIPVQRLFR